MMNKRMVGGTKTIYCLIIFVLTRYPGDFLTISRGRISAPFPIENSPLFSHTVLGKRGLFPVFPKLSKKKKKKKKKITFFFLFTFFLRPLLLMRNNDPHQNDT